ncbi:hypothetical protein YPC_4807 (plasmid) [Yersinia pestis biovar Medievalis str. Harbin 35]|nr:hypothetical protein YPC_4807 [Yersinia pestis biovar Medievalis str. Harbin 35]EEO74259.1 hypothetical protein YP516_4679 [Yersinia pestis Nepal516]EEO78755.1 hypothetical protein YPF_4842 [Yersinia pestis biovar Orientalis str. India 195]EEO88054.1 hypothetical protein YPS_4822 [Yersinia pestis Pestoides A]
MVYQLYRLHHGKHLQKLRAAQVKRHSCDPL